MRASSRWIDCVALAILRQGFKPPFSVFLKKLLRSLLSCRLWNRHYFDSTLCIYLFIIIIFGWNIRVFSVHFHCLHEESQFTFKKAHQAPTFTLDASTLNFHRPLPLNEHFRPIAQSTCQVIECIYSHKLSSFRRFYITHRSCVKSNENVYVMKQAHLRPC